ncbi:tail protein [Xanthomonas phage Langgrundblatt2]|jgi:cell wall-associated NlpC family hydrolase|uniref:Tail protein n=2 Tax=Shirevirus TaxID=3153128 RepID=A0A9E7E192_9CAUD|nr:tail protein [Xanthomonas phage Langgrundblatt1]YP_010742927.1 tail protein [Xanthomonas phage Langgrundblatt2]URA06809.1 tail protein [Xanthomonas phage Langgrundblatt1]URA06878.1 tail protein [Xanthomonas phage Langgrundblatt2]
MTDIAKRARALKDVPFLHQGRSFDGIDCVGLLAYAIRYDFDKIPPYPRDPYNSELENAMTAAFGPPLLLKPTIDQLQEGDLAAMQYRGPIRHVGIVLNHPTIPGALSLIHTDSMVERVTEHILDVKWLRRIEKVWRLG